ncbi:MAG TPA: ABC transporter permease [Chthonomonadaceae bacterium]|nr:ABC transporter permease [Chthonomonadaceae bacterium]
MRNLWRNAGAYIALVVVTLIFAIRQPEFRQPSNLLNILDQSVEIAVVAAGMTAIILTGGIDLSVGSIAALAPFLGAWVMTTQGGALGGFAGTALAGLLVALGVGALVGAVNGLSITKTFLPPFIATLGTMSIVRGLAFVVSHGTGISSGLPEGYTITARNLISVPTANGSSVNLTLAVLVMLVVYVVGQLILSRTQVGRAIYAIGGNEMAARLSGLRVDRIKLSVYIVGGFLAAVGGLVETAMVGAAVPQAGIDLELNAIAAVVIGGTSLMGGRGNLAGTFAGALLMRLIRNGLNLLDVDSNWQKVAIGAIIMIAVAFDEYQKRRSLRA